jgi:hypothetical protein
MQNTSTLVGRLRTRAIIRRSIRKRAEKHEGKEPQEDKIADLCDEAADRIEELEGWVNGC